MKTFASLVLAAFCLSAPAFASDTPPSAKPDLAAGEAKYTAMCAACHGADGNSGSPENPKLAGQYAPYLNKQLVEFKSGKRANACGLVAAGIAESGIVYVLADDSVAAAPPTLWASKAIALWRRLEADQLVVEVNQGGDMVRSVIHEIDAAVPVLICSGYGDNEEEVFLGHSVTQSKNVSEATAQIIDQEVRRLIEEGEGQAKRILTEHLDDLHTIAKGLLEYETLSNDEIGTILRGEPVVRDETGGAGQGGDRRRRAGTGQRQGGPLI